MELTTLHDLLVDQLKDLYSAEQQLARAMPKLTEAVASEEGRELFEQHLAETERQIGRLEQMGKILEVDLSGKKCAAMAGLVTEANEALSEEGDADVIDLAIMAAARRVEHYEISAYTSARALAEALEESEVLDLLEESLQEEEQTEQTLTVLSEDIIDVVAADELDAEDEEDEEHQPSV